MNRMLRPKVGPLRFAVMRLAIAASGVTGPSWEHPVRLIPSAKAVRHSGTERSAIVAVERLAGRIIVLGARRYRLQQMKVVSPRRPLVGLGLWR